MSIFFSNRLGKKDQNSNSILSCTINNFPLIIMLYPILRLILLAKIIFYIFTFVILITLLLLSFLNREILIFQFFYLFLLFIIYFIVFYLPFLPIEIKISELR